MVMKNRALVFGNWVALLLPIILLLLIIGFFSIYYNYKHVAAYSHLVNQANSPIGNISGLLFGVLLISQVLFNVIGAVQRWQGRLMRVSSLVVTLVSYLFFVLFIFSQPVYENISTVTFGGHIYHLTLKDYVTFSGSDFGDSITYILHECDSSDNNCEASWEKISRVIEGTGKLEVDEVNKTIGVKIDGKALYIYHP
jgi:hypothetical protein